MPHAVATPSSNDRALLTRLRAGERAAFQAIYDQYVDELLQFAGHFATASAVADDLVHDVMLWLWEHRATLEITTSLRVYLLSAVRRRALHVLRHERLVLEKQGAFGAEAAGIAYTNSATDAATDQLDMRSVIRDALAGLTPVQRLILSLRWHRQLSYPEIATILDITPDAAKQQVSRLQRSLRPLLEKIRL